jgi:hypothetical protein
VPGFDWFTFLNHYRVSYNTRGPNTPNGAATVACPFCGQADPSDHMVLWSGGSWACWRNTDHRGRHPAKLVQALIRCSAAEAARITASTSPLGSTDLDKVSVALTAPAPTPVPPLRMPADFKPLGNNWACEPYISYLRNRGIKGNARYLHYRYGLHYCTGGPFRGRIIFPVYHAGKLVSWTGRSIYQAEEIRYKSLTTDPEAASRMQLEPAIGPINHYLMWYDWIATNADAHTIVLVEGSFDALKINTLGEPTIVSTCWLGSQPTTVQIEKLHTLVKPYVRRIVLSDSDMTEKADKIASQLRALDFKAVVLPKDVDDPAEIADIKQLAAILAC